MKQNGKLKPGIYQGGPCDEIYLYHNKYWYIWGWNPNNKNDWYLIWIDERYMREWGDNYPFLRQISKLEFLVLKGMVPPVPSLPTEKEKEFVRKSRRAYNRQCKKGKK